MTTGRGRIGFGKTATHLTESRSAALSVNHLRENGSCAFAQNNAPEKRSMARKGTKPAIGRKIAPRTLSMLATDLTDFAIRNVHSPQSCSIRLILSNKSESAHGHERTRKTQNHLLIFKFPWFEFFAVNPARPYIRSKPAFPLFLRYLVVVHSIPRFPIPVKSRRSPP